MRWFYLLMLVVLPSATVGSSSEEPPLPDGVSQLWWSSVQRELAVGEYHVSENAQGLQAPNRSHNLRTYFEPTGIHLHDRTAAGQLLSRALQEQFSNC